MIHAFIVAGILCPNDARFYFDLARVHAALKTSTSFDEADKQVGATSNLGDEIMYNIPSVRTILYSSISQTMALSKDFKTIPNRSNRAMLSFYAFHHVTQWR
jgi:hypothetical protein